MNDIIKTKDGKYIATLPFGVALDFARYLITYGIPAEYTCKKRGTDNREIVFGSTTENADIMLSWINRWKDGHELCPFCGQVPHVIEGGDYQYIECTGCGCKTRGVYRWMEESYVWKLWDKRERVN